MPKKIDLSGKIFNNVKVINEFPQRSSSRKIQYDCICLICKNEFTAIGNNIVTGETKNCFSCKCEKLKKHGFSKTKIYNIWASMKYRCSDTSNKNYAGRGINFCERWEVFENFLEDMGSEYSEGLYLERVNNDLGYFKENCCWDTAKSQTLNRRKPLGNTSSKYRNVSRTSKNRWSARITIDGVVMNIGSYIDETDAAKAVDTFIKQNGLKNKLNFEE